MKAVLILLVVALIALSPVLTATLSECCSGGLDVAMAYDVGGNGSSEFWDWCVLFWTTFMNLTDWPV